MSFINTISFKNASGKLKRIYDRIKGPNGHIDHVLSIHSLRPHTLEGHMALYKAVLHHSGNNLPKWYLETIGTYISQINSCHYCATHHAVGIKKNLQDDEKYEAIISAMESGNFENVLEEKLVLGIKHSVKLTKDHANIRNEDIEQLRSVGFNDGEILEINQVSSYFNYVNR